MIENEIDALDKTNHKNIIQLISYNTQIEHTMLVFEYMKHGDLYNYLRYSERFELSVCKRFFDQIVDGLYYLHNKLHIAHRDLNPKNLLLDDNFDIKIADFGCCLLIDTHNIDVQKRLQKLHSNEKLHSNLTAVAVGTLGYIAPEIILPKYQSTIASNPSVQEQLSCDVFSLGIILWKMMMGIDSEPFEKFVPPEQSKLSSGGNYATYQLIEQKKYNSWWEKVGKNNIPYLYDNDLKHLFSSMFDPLPQTRITLSDIQNHKWYTKNSAKYKNGYFITQMKKMYLHKSIAMHTSLELPSLHSDDLDLFAALHRSPLEIDDPLIAMIDIGKNDSNDSKNYDNVIKTFVNPWNYKILYKNSKDEIVYTNNMTTILQGDNASYKLYWTCDDIQLYLEQVRMHLINNKHIGLIFFINCYGDYDVDHAMYDSMMNKYNLNDVFNMGASQSQKILERRSDKESKLKQESDDSHLNKIPKVFCLDLYKKISNKNTSLNGKPKFEMTEASDNKTEHVQDSNAQKHQLKETNEVLSKIKFQNNLSVIYTNFEENYDVQVSRNVCKIFSDADFRRVTWSNMIFKIDEYTKRDASVLKLLNGNQIIGNDGSLETSITFHSCRRRH